MTSEIGSFDRELNAKPMLFLNFNQANAGCIESVSLPRDYVLACRFLHCSIIDRTETLKQGFAYRVLDPIPPPSMHGPTFAELCNRRGEELVKKAMRLGKEIGVLWSGGIDSTTALIAVMKAAEAWNCQDQVTVLLSMDSVLEYPEFFLDRIDRRYQITAVTHPVSRMLDPAMLTITGEHGDQLFGSHLLESYVRRGLAGVDYQDILPLVLLERLKHPLHVRRVRGYLQPVIAAAPVPIISLFDYLWWLNFSLKWQEVTLRLTVFRGHQARAIYKSLQHFYRTEAFQAWALASTPGTPVPGWAQYKRVAKEYIHDFTGDWDYFRLKEKEDSLRNVLAASRNGERHRAFMRDDFRPHVTSFSPPAESGIAGVLRSGRDIFRGANVFL